MNRLWLFILLIALLFGFNGLTVPGSQSYSAAGKQMVDMNGYSLEKVSEASLEIKKMGLFEELNEFLDQRLSRSSGGAFRNNSLFYKLIPVFSFLMIVFIVSIVAIMILVFSVKYYRHYRYKKRKKIWALYKEILISYLNEQNETDVPYLPNLDHTTNKKILIEQLFELANVIYGRKQIKLRYLYRDNNLQPYLIKKIRRGTWPIKSVYLKYLSIRPFRGEMLVNLSRFNESSNPQVRLNSQLAYISQYSDQALSFLKGYSHTLTEWDQLNLYETLIHNSIPVPDLYEFLQSGNESVIVFALRLIRWYYLKSRNPEDLLRLINHSNEQIRLEAYKTIVELKVRGVDDLFRYYYLNETPAVKKVMIDYFVRKKQLRKQMYREILEIETDNTMLFYLLESFYNQSLNNQQELKDLRDQTEYQSIRSMCHHIIENAS